MAKQTRNLDEAKAHAKKVIARWRDAILGERFGNAAQWALASGVDPTTIRRNMDEGYQSTTKIENLHLLARAANLPSVIDFLENQAADPLSSSLVPSAGELAEMIQGVMDELPLGVSYADYPKAVSSGLRARLEQYRASGGSAGNRDAGSALDKGALSRSATKLDAVAE